MKLTKTFALAALVAGSLLAGNTALQAQDNTNTPPASAPPASGMKGRGLNFDAISKQLELTDDQKPKVKTVIDDLTQKQRDLRADTTVAMADKRAKAKELRDAATAKLKDILTPEQLTKWEKMSQRQRPQAAPPQQ
jgi:Spy/CpxP family protein refolding chaperone